ncbi:MAG: hypothetical protein KKF79_01385 [Gammaproteobacteria bacterium]|nr:hypothetical protein [Gammaproteobacteria bacterium]
MSYWLFRLQLYRQSLRQWLSSLQQIGFGLVVLFPMALPVLIFLPLLSLGVAANPATTVPVYLNTLWGYLLLLFSWMKLQQAGIYGTDYQLYLNSLPTSARLKKLADAGLILYSANFFVLGPLVLLSFVLVQQSNKLFAAGSQQFLLELVPLAGLLLLALYYSFSALRRKIPWLSLFLLPYLALLAPLGLSKPQWLLCWGVAIVLESYLPLPTFKLGRWPQGLFRLLLRADLHSPSAEGLRLVALLLLIALTRVCIAAMHPDIVPYLLNAVSFFTGLLLASSLFSTQALRVEYQLYLASLPQSAAKQLATCVGYVLAKTSIGVLLLLTAGIFDIRHWGLWLLFYLVTMIGIWFRPKMFLLLPCAVGVMLVLGQLFLG